MEEPMEIVDAHMHLWSTETHPWLETVRHGGHPAGKFGKRSDETPPWRCMARSY